MFNFTLLLYVYIIYISFQLYHLFSFSVPYHEYICECIDYSVWRSYKIKYINFILTMFSCLHECIIHVHVHVYVD